MSAEESSAQVLTPAGLEQLLTVLRQRGYRTLGPTIREGVIAYDEIACVQDLPCGWTDEQSGGHYRLRHRDDRALFGYAVGPHSWKQFLHPPRQRLWSARRDGETLQVRCEPPGEHRLALIGVRACELRAIAIQDRVLLGTAPGDPHYRARRTDTFIVAVNCTLAGSTCFCASMHSGPQVTGGFDLALTELTTTASSAFVLQAGTSTGRAVLEQVPHRAASAAETAAARALIEHTAEHMGRQLPSDDLPQLLLRSLEHPRWSEVADRCLACGNCTMVCPTCFCSTVEDSSDLIGQETTRTRRWDSCFAVDVAHLHGGSVRQSTRSRYRQWMTHKLATWHQQFGSSGCVGCGRCITWCPVGIDITEEVTAIRASEPT
ncbi:MAG: 4Fe-4S dicluster domain-containing protein [Steroidobacteraceae bacterium]